MARRVRRDLSNKKIRKIVDQKLTESRKPTPPQKASSFSFNRLFKRAFYLLILASIGFLVYFVFTSPTLLNLFSEQNSTIPRRHNLQERSKTISSAVTAEKQPDPQPTIQPVKQKMQVEVLNGCGIKGIAATTTDYLRKSEIDVVFSGNYTRYDVTQSMVIDRVGNKSHAEKIAEILGIRNEQIKTELNPSRQLDVTVVLGKDYFELKPFKQ